MKVFIFSSIYSRTLVIVRVALLGSIAVLVLGCLCEDETKETFHSPQGDFVVEWIERDCGATTDWSQLITARLARSWFNNEELIVAFAGRPEIEVCWRSKSQEVVILHTPAEVFPKTGSWKEASFMIREISDGSNLSCETANIRSASESD